MPSPGAFLPAVRCYVDREGKNFHCRVAFPGVGPREVKIEPQGNAVRVSGERRVSDHAEEANSTRKEICYRTFQASDDPPGGH